MIGSTLYLVGFTCEWFNTFSRELNYVNEPAPCSLCKRMIINAGIKKVVVRVNKTEYRIFNPKLWTRDNIIGGY